MNKRSLAEHKAACKNLADWPEFKPLKKNKRPKPFNRMGGSRVHATELIDVSDTHCVFLLWRDGEVLTDTSFYGYMMCKLGTGHLSPILEFHWHPSHKEAHVKLPCGTTQDYTDRGLPGAPELQVKLRAPFDPRSQAGREALICTFCTLSGIALGGREPGQGDLWQ